MDQASDRSRMVERQIAARGVRDPRVLDAMRTVPREAFVERRIAAFAHEDSALPIAEGQTISQPYIVALMAEAAEIKPADRVLDVGTGSGYAAAVLAELAQDVYTIERHQKLCDQAAETLRGLGYGQISTRCGDGTRGWPEAAPFDAILVAAAGLETPPALLAQLKVGGRLIIPVGPPESQTLWRIRRAAEDRYERDDLGDVRFVPLIAATGAAAWSPRAIGKRASPDETVELIKSSAEALPDPDEVEIGRFVDRFADARVVLMGEATHGTHEFYCARARLTERLIQEHGFTIVAAEADWPDAAQVDRYVRGRMPQPLDEPAFARFPTWMWRNKEVESFAKRLKLWNEGHTEARKAGFYGIDLYSLGASIAAVLDYLDKVDPEAARAARERYGCLAPWQKDPATYGRAALTTGYAQCEKAVLATLSDLLAKRLDYLERDGESFLDAAQNARLVAAAERYYRAMYYGGAESWNLRDSHMFDTLLAVMQARGPAAKAVVWAHNSHVGNAAATEMGRVRDELNIGQLARERFGDDAALIGFGTDRGTVAAASDWGGAMEIKQVRPARPDSYEALSRHAGARFALDLRAAPADLEGALSRPRLERAIGVIYRPESELLSHYFEAELPRQFDAWLWFEETRAVAPLAARQRAAALPDTWPFGL